jgi:O-phosphoseryl-tRNA synthetase
MNLGLGVERMAMIMNKAKDVRELCFPQFFPVRYTDTDLAAGITLLAEPATTMGKKLVRSLVDTAVTNSAATGPCSFVAFEGEIAGRMVKVLVEEPEEDAKLLGPACMNEIFVYKGAVLGVPDTEKFAEIRKNGVTTGISYLFAAASKAAAEIEQAAHFGIPTTVQVKMARLPGDINLRIEPWVMRYITDNNLKTDVRGPVFLTIRSEILPDNDA